MSRHIVKSLCAVSVAGTGSTQSGHRRHHRHPVYNDAESDTFIVNAAGDEYGPAIVSGPYSDERIADDEGEYDDLVAVDEEAV